MIKVLVLAEEYYEEAGRASAMGAWVKVSAGIVRGKKMTCLEAIRDGNLITSRHPPDLPDFCGEILKALEL